MPTPALAAQRMVIVKAARSPAKTDRTHLARGSNDSLLATFSRIKLHAKKKQPLITYSFFL